MSRSHKARFDRYPNHRVWWLKNVRFAPRRLSPRERVTSASDQLDEHLSDTHQARSLERKVQRELLQEADVMFDGWRDFEDSAWLDFEDYDSSYDQDRDYECRCSYADHDRVVEEDEVTETDPRWVDEYLLGADTGLEERNDWYDYYFDDDDLYDSCERDFWDAWPSHDVLSKTPFDIAEHRERERLKAGDRHYRSHR